MDAVRIRVNGTVQGVGFRPTVWQIAADLGVAGQVYNDGEGVVVEAWGETESLQLLARRIESEPPPLARIDSLVASAMNWRGPPPAQFTIGSSRSGDVTTAIAADAKTCSACLAEVLDSTDRRYRYPFTNCTHCGPRLSIVNAIPYDRCNTSMAKFSMCSLCQAEYDNPADRRFHAQPNACPQCGPGLWLERSGGERLDSGIDGDSIVAAAKLIKQGCIVAVKGIGGIHLVCDAGDTNVVKRLRQRKHRYHKALALMALDVDMVRRHAAVTPAEEQLLCDSAAPIVVLEKCGESLAPAIAPGQGSLGFMLPYTPLHHLLMQEMDRPLVMTSGNRSDEPQVCDNGDCRVRLAQIADYFLLHDRDIVNRLDDSVLRVVAGAPQILRRARGHAPRPVPIPAGFPRDARVLAMGGELKNTFCLARDSEAVLSQHMGDLEDASTHRDYQGMLDLYRRLYDFTPTAIAVDHHPDYLSTQLGYSFAAQWEVPVIEVQHHHAHIAACMADNGLPFDTGPVLGIAMDGLGMGEEGELWGGEFLLASYSDSRRVAGLQAVPMLGGAQAMREPWRNTLSHLLACQDWDRLAAQYAGLDIIRFLKDKPLPVLRTMAERRLNSPLASSVGRLFDAVAAAVGVCRETASFEGQAAIELEALALPFAEEAAADAYVIAWRDDSLQFHELWQAILRDLEQGVVAGAIAARFHLGLARAAVDKARRLCAGYGLDTVALGGGVFQNALLLEVLADQLRDHRLKVLLPRELPANDGGLSYGQAVVALAAQRRKPGTAK